MIGTICHDLIDMCDAVGSSSIGFQRRHTNVFQSVAITIGLNLSLFCGVYCHKGYPIQKFQRSVRALHGLTHEAARERGKKISFCRIDAIDCVGRVTTIKTGLPKQSLCLFKGDHEEKPLLIGVLLKGSPSVLCCEGSLCRMTS